MSNAQAAALPLPLVRLKEHPFKWMLNKAKLLAAAVVLAHAGTLIVTALYYLLFEVNPTMNGWWHSTVANATLRHDIRDVAEGLLGGLLAQAVTWNHYRKRRPSGRLDRVEKFCHIPNLGDDRRLSFGETLSLLVWVPLYAAPVFVGLYFAIGAFHHGAAVPLPADASTWARFQGIWTQDWPQKLIGLASSLFFGRRVARAVFDDAQLWFAERRVANGQRLYWYHPPTFQARYNDVRAAGMDAEAAKQHGGLRSALMLSGITLGLALAGYGYYVLTYKAG